MKVNFFDQLNRLDKLLVLLIFPIPFILSLSIFVSDLFVSLGGIIFLFLIWDRENIKIINKLQKEIILFLVFFFIILTSLILSDYKDYSFLASFFYFRYFLLSMILFFLLIKYEFTLNIFYYIILSSFSLIIFDSIVQLIFDYNLLGYQKIGTNTETRSLEYLTSFFGSEKKLGSFLIRFLPLIISLIYIKNYKNNLLSVFFLILMGFVIFQTSERAALFLFGIFCLLIVLNSQKKILLSSFLVLFITILLASDKPLRIKYIMVTLEQTKLIYILKNNENTLKILKKIGLEEIEDDPLLVDITRYYSKEHEDLSMTGLEIFKRHLFFGSGIKSFYHECNNLKSKGFSIKNKRDNKLTCSTHPHNTYVQILSDIGIFGFLIVIFVLGYLIRNIFIIIRKKEQDNLDISFLFINIGLLLNIFPLIPSGSFFNNWISLIIFFNLGFLFFIKNKIQIRDNS